MLGDIKTSIYFAEKTLKIIDDCNLGHKVNDLKNLCKLYTDIGILYGIYLDDFDSSLKYYSLAKSNISKNDHYIKYRNLTILEAYILFTSGDSVKSQEVFNKALTIFKIHDHSDTFVQSLLITCFWVFLINSPTREMNLYKRHDI